MEADLVIRNCRFPSSHSHAPGGVAIQAGKIVAVASDADLPRGRQEIDGAGKVLLPGILDTHVHLRDPGAIHKEDFATGTRGAAVGGITTLLDMPNTAPPITTAERLREKAEILARRSYVHYGLYAVITARNIEAIPALAREGAVGFKLFMTPPPQGDLPCPDDGAILEAMRRTAETGLPFGAHAENASIVDAATAALKQRGRTDPAAHSEARPSLAEVESIARLIRFARATRCRLHIYHLTTAEGLELVRQAKADGLPVTAETCPHYLLLTQKDLVRLGPVAKCNPPLRTEEDVAALWNGVEDGTIDILASDHAPQGLAGKNHPVIWDNASGICGIQLFLPLMLNQVVSGRLSLERLVRLTAEQPARHYGLYPRKGTILVGADADLTLVDLDRQAEVRGAELESKTKQNPFEAMILRGWPTLTVVSGKVVMRDGQIVSDPPCGSFVRPNS